MVQAENLRARIADASLVKNRPVTVSVGVAECGPELTQDSWLKAADTALYQAKESGRNKVVRAPSPVPGPAAELPDPERRVRQG